MTIDDGRRPSSRRKPLWPWLALLVMTLCAIYTYNRVSEILDDVIQNAPDAVIRLFNDLLRSEQGGKGDTERVARN